MCLCVCVYACVCESIYMVHCKPINLLYLVVLYIYISHKYIFNIYVYCGFAYKYAYHMCAGWLWKSKKESLYMTVSHNVGAENLSWVILKIGHLFSSVSPIFTNYQASVFSYRNKKSWICYNLSIFLSLQFILHILFTVIILKLNLLIQSIHKLIICVSSVF